MFKKKLNIIIKKNKQINQCYFIPHFVIYVTCYSLSNVDQGSVKWVSFDSATYELPFWVVIAAVQIKSFKDVTCNSTSRNVHREIEIHIRFM